MHIRTTLGSIAIGLAVPALAQSATSAAEPVLDEILVTAQRRQQRLQDVPIAVTALSERFLQERAVVSINDIQRYTPGLNIAAGWSGSYLGP